MNVGCIVIKLYLPELARGWVWLAGQTLLPTPGLGDLQGNLFNSQNQVGKNVPILAMTG